MKPLSADTHPEAERVWIAGLRRLSPAQRLARMAAMSRFADRLAEAEVRRRYPAADDREVRLRVASRRLPRELMRRAFGWDPDAQGY